MKKVLKWCNRLDKIKKALDTRFGAGLIIYNFISQNPNSNVKDIIKDTGFNRDKCNKVLNKLVECNLVKNYDRSHKEVSLAKFKITNKLEEIELQLKGIDVNKYSWEDWFIPTDDMKEGNFKVIFKDGVIKCGRYYGKNWWGFIGEVMGTAFKEDILIVKRI